MRPSLHVLVLGVGLAAGVVTAVACSGNAQECDPSSCTGCCDSNGLCQPGFLPDACGVGGALCQVCTGGTACSSGFCVGGGGGGGGGHDAGSDAGGLPDGGSNPDGGLNPDGGIQPDGGTKPDAGQGTAVVIDFDDLSAGAVVTTQYAQWATFSTPNASGNVVLSPGLAHSLPNFICATTTCAETTVVNFTVPVRNLSFWSICADGTPGTQVATANIYVNGAFAASVAVPATGSCGVGLVDAGAYTDVTRLELTNITDSSGIGWDDFSFTVPAP